LEAEFDAASAQRSRCSGTPAATFGPISKHPTDGQRAGTASTRSRVQFLDGLRGIAALFVVLSHSTGAFFPAVLFGGECGFSQVLYATRSDLAPTTDC
jgi:hypothetical protein